MKSILLVEDERITAMTTMKFLNKSGFETVTVSSGEAAVDYMKTGNTPDLILMDIDLGPGGMDGPEAAGIILSDADIPIVFNSSHTEEEIVEKTEKITSYGYIVKNTGPTVLLTTIRLAFKLFNAHRKLKQREEDLRQSEERMRLALRCVPVTIFQQDGKLRYTWMHGRQENPQLDSVLGKTDADLFPPEFADLLTTLKARALEGADVRDQISTFEGGDTRYYDIIANPLYDATGAISGITGASWDITVVKRMEELQKVRLRLDSLARIQTTDQILIVIGKEAARLTGSVSGFLRNLGDVRNTYDLGSAWIECASDGGPVILNGNEGPDEAGNELAVPVYQGESVGAVLCVRGKPSDYNTRDVAILNQLAGFAGDIVSRMRAIEMIKESEKRLKEAERIAELGHYEIDTVTGDSMWSEGCFLLFGYGNDNGIVRESPSIETYKEMVHPEDREKVFALFDACVRDNKPFDLIYRIIRRDGEIRHMRSRSNTVTDGDGRVIKLFGTLKDVTERKCMEEELTGLVKQREILLKELQHRVKNNMNLVSSLLHLEREQVRDKEARRIFQEAQNRIHAMAIVYEQLFHSPDLRSVELDGYIEHLAESLYRAYVSDTEKIRFAFNLDKTTLELRRTVSLGLIINELITNALKYAFPDGRKGEIVIELRKKSAGFVLRIADNGVGLPEGITRETGGGFGLTMIRLLSQEIDGRLSIQTEQGSGTKVEVET